MSRGKKPRKKHQVTVSEEDERAIERLYWGMSRTSAVCCGLAIVLNFALSRRSRSPTGALTPLILARFVCIGVSQGAGFLDQRAGHAECVAQAAMQVMFDLPSVLMDALFSVFAVMLVTNNLRLAQIRAWRLRIFVPCFACGCVAMAAVLTVPNAVESIGPL